MLTFWFIATWGCAAPQNSWLGSLHAALVIRQEWYRAAMYCYGTIFCLERTYCQADQNQRLWTKICDILNAFVVDHQL